MGLRVIGHAATLFQCTVASDPAAIASKGQREFILAFFSAEVNPNGGPLFLGWPLKPFEQMLVYGFPLKVLQEIIDIPGAYPVCGDPEKGFLEYEGVYAYACAVKYAGAWRHTSNLTGISCFTASNLICI